MPIAQTRLETLQICKLLQCVRDGDKEQIEKLTVNGVPHLINYNEPNEGETALNIAAVANNEAMIEFLLELGAHPDVLDFKSRSAVMRAAEYGHVQCVHHLAKAGADMTQKDIQGKGVIFYCINETQRHDKCLEIVLNHGADVNNASHDGVPVFQFACETAKDNENMCIMLLNKGAEPNSKNEKTKRTALHAACASGSAKVVRAILERGAEVNELMARPKYHASHEAAKGGFLDCLQVLSAYGANFDQIDDLSGNNPIHLAAMGGHAMCIKFLSQRGCNPKPKNAEGNQAKGIAKDLGHKEAAKEGRKAEKSFGKVGKNNEPWALALYDFCYERQQALLDMYQKFDADSTGYVPREDILEGLENMGAPIPQENEMKTIIAAHEKGKDTGVDYNEFLGGKKYINKQYLMSAFEGKKKKKKGGKGKKKKGKTKIPMPICTQPDGPRANDGGPPESFIPRHIHYTDTGRFDRDQPPRHQLEDDSAWYLHKPEKSYLNINNATKHADLDSLKDAFSKGIPVDTRDKYYKTPLMVASVNGRMDVVKYLVENGANVNAQDNFKWAPLHFACHAGMFDIVEYLLEQGSQLEMTTVNGATPLMRAIESSKPEIVQFLIDKGAKVQIENKKGMNPVDIAAAFADPRVYDIVKIKYDSLPAPNDKKKGKGKGGKGRPKSSGTGDGGKHPVAVIENTNLAANQENIAPGRARKGSILRAASALAGGIEEREDITYTPLKVWTKQSTTQDMLCEREVRRDRFGWEVDFEDFKMPFLKNIERGVEVMGGPEDDD